MAKQDWFKEIGLSYCENFDEVETARTEFLRQRDSILAYLSDIAERAIADAKLKVLGAPQREDGWDNWPLGGRWTKIRSKLGKKSEWQSGIYFGIDHDPCFKEEGGNRFGFCASLFFAMSQDRFGKLRHSLANAAKARHGAIDFWPGDDSACVRTAWIRPGDKQFTLTSFEREIRRLPQLFREIDEVVGSAYARSKGL